MDLLGSYNSDSDSDESAAVVTSAAAAPPVVSKAKLPPPATKTTTTTDPTNKKRRVIGKKLLKLSAVLPQHILKQLQLAGTKRKQHDDSDDDSDDNDGSSSDDEEDNRPAAKPLPKPAAPRDYSRDEGLVGLLSELSNSGSSAATRYSQKPKSILGNDDDDDQQQQHDGGDESSSSSTKPKTTIEQPLGAAFLTTTVETVTRKRNAPVEVRSIHEDDPLSSRAAPATMHRPVARAAAPSVRSAAPRVSAPRQPDRMQPRQQPQYQIQQPQMTKKKLSRKRQMEQLLRSGNLHQVEGDHELQGVEHVYHHEGSEQAPVTGVVFAGAVKTNVTSRQKGTNQLNSLLANAASLETRKAQNPHFSMGGKQGNTHRATAKRKYGW